MLVMIVSRESLCNGMRNPGLNLIRPLVARMALAWAACFAGWYVKDAWDEDLGEDGDGILGKKRIRGASRFLVMGEGRVSITELVEFAEKILPHLDPQVTLQTFPYQQSMKAEGYKGIDKKEKKNM